MQNVIPMFTWQDKDQVRELDRSHREIDTLKKSVDLYRNIASRRNNELTEIRNEGIQLRQVIQANEEFFETLSIPKFNSENDLSHPSVLQAVNTIVTELNQRGSDVSELARVIEELQKVVSKQALVLSNICQVSSECLSEDE